MTTINSSTDNPWGGLGLATQNAAGTGALAQADFLKLMTEQLKHQDPLKPLANTEFLGQLAQFSTVQGIESMQSAMTAMASVMESDQTLRAAALVGRDALVEADTVTLDEGGTLQGELTVTTAGPVHIEIVDAAGVVVRRVDFDAPSAGNVDWEWDGLDAAGDPIAAGTYSIRASSGSGDTTQALDVRVAARIDSVSIEPTGLVLNLAGVGSLPLSSVRRIS